jgi:hypothetical protein
MNWKVKAKIQNIVSVFPSSLSYATYYWIQRHFGNLRRQNPISKLSAAIETYNKIHFHGRTFSDKIFLEVGTGRVPIVPIAYWLMGAEKTITIDLNPYMKSELVAESLNYISIKSDEILNLFGSLIDKKRYNELLALGNDNHFSLSSILELCRVEYIAPGDAANTLFPERSIDYHTSNAVFEHIPSEVLIRILKEGNRIIKENGMFIHRIDYSDHFSHSDKGISSINFLQYSDKEWERLAGNRYMYMNRLRHDDFLKIYESVGQYIIEAQPNTDPKIYEILRNGSLRLNERFSSKSQDVLAITWAWIVSQKAANKHIQRTVNALN